MVYNDYKYKMLKLEFEDPNSVIVGKERKSKLLKQNSELYSEAERKRKILESTYGKLMDDKRMDFHTELIKDSPTDELLLQRTQLLEGKYVNPNAYTQTSKSIGIIGPYLEGYGNTHITLGYFKNGLPNDNYSELLK
jgi:hypothetical protein